MGVDQIGALKQSQTPLITHSSSSCTIVTTLYLIPERRFHGNTTCAPVFLVPSLSEVVPKRLRLYPASCAFVLGDCVRKKVCQAWSKHRKIAPDVINPAQGVLRVFASVSDLRNFRVNLKLVDYSGCCTDCSSRLITRLVREFKTRTAHSLFT